MFKWRFKLFFNNKKFTKKNLNSQMLRMIIATKLFLKNINNIKLQKTFVCLNFEIRFFSSNILKRQLMKKIQKITKNLLKNFLNYVKIFVVLNCWSSFNRQNYFAINVYWIDEIWIYRKKILNFVHVNDFHTNEKLIKILKINFKRHNLFTKILIFRMNNAENNNFMHEILIV